MTSRRSRTIGDLAGRLGIGPSIVLPATRRLVDDGPASPLIRPGARHTHVAWITASHESRGAQ
jgi:hypothetical protein